MTVLGREYTDGDLQKKGERDFEVWCCDESFYLCFVWSGRVSNLLSLDWIYIILSIKLYLSWIKLI